MIKIILSILGAYYAANYIKNIWLAVSMAIVLALISNIVMTIIIVELLQDVDSEAAIYSMIAGLVWYSVIALIAFVVFRKRKKIEAVEILTFDGKGKAKTGKDRYGVDLVVDIEPNIHKDKQSSDRYWFMENSKKCGPIDKTELLNLHKKGIIVNETRVLSHEGNKWKKFAELQLVHQEPKPTEVARNSESTFCTQCGKKTHTSHKFCGSCGKQLF